MKHAAGIVIVTMVSSAAWAGERVRIDLGDAASFQGGTAFKMMLVLTLLSLVPAILLSTTSFVRIILVFSFLRNALGLQNAPPNQIFIGLALFLTVAIMAPTATKLYDAGVEPYLDGKIGPAEALAAGTPPLRDFMLKHTRVADLALFYQINNGQRPETPADVKLHMLIPAFVISELRTGFEMGFLIFIPFLIVDLIVASVLMGLGMVMLPPSLVSLPLKLLLFVAADGWNVLVGSLVRSFA